jgi:hypothetical protein
LIMPQSFAGLGVQGNQGVREEIRALPVSSVAILGSGRYRKIHNASVFIATHRRPDIGAASIAPGIFLPGIIPELSRMRHRVKPPDGFARERIKRANVATRSLRQTVGNR